MPFVADASIVAPWLLPDESDPVADIAYERLKADLALVPRHWWFELRNVLLVAERRGRVSRTELDGLLVIAARLPIRTRDDVDENGIFRLARAYRLTVYDAAYLDLAIRSALPLATLDKQLIAAAKAEAVALIGIDS